MQDLSDALGKSDSAALGPCSTAEWDRVGPRSSCSPQLLPRRLDGEAA